MQCNEAQSLIPLFLENKLTLDQKCELVRHIRGCSRCREELEFYYVVYDTIGKFDDQMVSGDYAAEAERMLLQVEQERQAAVRISRVRRFRLAAVFLFLTIGMSIGVQRATPLEGNNPVVMAKPSFCLDGFELPGELYFVKNAMEVWDEEAGRFAHGQRMRILLRQSLYERDVPVMHMLKAGTVLEYELPEQVLNGAVLAGDTLPIEELAGEGFAEQVQGGVMAAEESEEKKRSDRTIRLRTPEASGNPAK